MGGEQNSVHLITKGGVDSWPLMAKSEVAVRLVDVLATMLREKDDGMS